MSAKSSQIVVANRQPEIDAVSLELKHILETCGTASLLSKQNLKILGDPGAGKTSILHFMARQVFGQYEEGGHYRKLECSGSMRPELITGHENPLWALTAEAERQGIPYWIYKGTPRDPDIWHVLLNELPRLGDIARDALLPIMDIDLNVFHAVTFWADGNTAMTAPSQWALNDRFSINIWYTAPVVDVKGIMKHGKPATWTYSVPDIQAIDTVRGWLDEWQRINPKTGEVNGFNTNAYTVIENAINTVMEVIPGTEFTANNRRIAQWIAVLYAMGAYYAGKPDFQDLPTEAYEALSYCYPFEDHTKQLKWRSIVMKSVDPLATKIAEFEANAMAHWETVYESEIKTIQNPQQRQQTLERKIGSLLASYQKTLVTEYRNDPRAKAAVNRLTGAYREMQMGRWTGSKK